MKIYQLVFKDVLRRKRRMLYASLGVAIGTMTVIGIMTISQAGQLRIYDQLEKYGPNLTIAPSINNLDMRLGNLSLGTLSVGENYIDQDLLPEIRQIADGEIRHALDLNDQGDIATIAPKLYLPYEVKNVSVILVGIDTSQELFIKTWWKVAEGGFPTGPGDALVGAINAQLLGLGIGDNLNINGETVKVTGILSESGSGDDYQIFIPLPTLQRAFDKQGLISSVDVRALCNACPVETIAGAINNELPGVRAIAVQQIAMTEMAMMDRLNNFMLALAGVTIAVGLFGVINTMISSINERYKDIGIMRAVGASRGQIIRIFLYEAVIVGIIGGVMGYLIGSLLAYLIGPLIFEGIVINLVPEYLVISILLASAIALLATLYPAFHATRIKVADSFRSL